VKYKKILFALLSLILTMPSMTFANVNIVVDKNNISFIEQSLVILNGITFIPLRGIFDKIGFSIDWNANTKTAVLKDDGITITAKENFMEINDNGNVILASEDMLPKLVNNYFMLPISAISLCTNAKIKWDSENKTVIITTNNNGIEDRKAPEGKMTVIDTDYLKTIFGAISKIRKQSEENAFGYFLDIADKTVLENEINAEKINEILSSISMLNPPIELSKVQEDIREYVNLCNKVISLFDDKLSDKKLIENLDKLKEDKKELSSRFASDLYDYFENKEVSFEKIYGEDILDILN